MACIILRRTDPSSKVESNHKHKISKPLMPRLVHKLGDYLEDFIGGTGNLSFYKLNGWVNAGSLSGERVA
jgi:hypothetical protein